VPRLYLCDDADDYRSLVKAVFSSEADLEIVGEAADGAACIAGGPAANPDVVLLDIDMPRMNGLDAIVHLRAAMPDVHVVMLTTAPAVDAEDEAMRRGADAFIEKPRNVFDLPDVVRNRITTLDSRRSSGH
jgi:two-component system chemotaxis response regulator CheB